MGDLIVLSRPKPPVAAAVDAEHSAAILFFTGVRYYRMDGEASPATQPDLAELAPPKRRRSPERRRGAKRARPERLVVPA